LFDKVNWKQKKKKKGGDAAMELPGHAATKGRRCDAMAGIACQVATYLLHLVKRVMVHARFLKVIERGLDHLLDDLLVDIALVVAVSKRAFTLPLLLACARPWGILTTTAFDMATVSNLLQLSSAWVRAM
jgi:hypothetical protein